jgi:hypothetical protein
MMDEVPSPSSGRGIESDDVVNYRLPKHWPADRGQQSQ